MSIIMDRFGRTLLIALVIDRITRHKSLYLIELKRIGTVLWGEVIVVQRDLMCVNRMGRRKKKGGLIARLTFTFIIRFSQILISYLIISIF